MITKMQKSVELKADAGKVWQVLFDEQYIKQWYTAFGEDVQANTDWQQGSKAIFTNRKGDGIAGRIISSEKGKTLTIEYDAMLAKGEEDVTSEIARSIKGTQEIYTLLPASGGTILSISVETGDAYQEMMSSMWDVALRKIKELSENH